MKTIRVGIIGCGAIAQQAHVPAYSKCAGVEIVALADIHEGRLHTLGETVGAKGLYTDYRQMFVHERLDAVSVCTPNYLHGEQTIAAAKQGIHVLCEKPMAVSLVEADAMVQAADEHEVVLMVGFTHRFMNHNIRAKEMLDAGVIGEPFMIRARFAHDGPYISWSAKSDWFFRLEQARGGALLDMGIHAIDMCRYFMGEVASVIGQTGTLVKDIEVEDSALALLTFASGAHGYIDVGWSSKTGRLGFEIYGTEGSLVVDYVTPIQLWTKKTGAWENITDATGGGWDNEIGEFIQAVRQKRKPSVDGGDGRIGVAIALATYASAQKGKAVTVERGGQE